MSLPKVLNVGCGLAVSFRSVNVDIRVDKTIHKGFVFIRCDAHFLPFRNKIFAYVLASHVLEHVDNPFIALKEWKRVSDKAIIKIPNISFTRVCEPPAHIYSWSESSFRSLLLKVYDHVKIFGAWHQSIFYGTGVIKALTSQMYRLLSFFQMNELVGVCEIERDIEKN